jgi:hypothetical protein
MRNFDIFVSKSYHFNSRYGRSKTRSPLSVQYRDKMNRPNDGDESYGKEALIH